MKNSGSNLKIINPNQNYRLNKKAQQSQNFLQKYNNVGINDQQNNLVNQISFSSQMENDEQIKQIEDEKKAEKSPKQEKCEQFVLKINHLQPYTHIVFKKHEIYYGQFSSNEYSSKNGLGFHYSVTYDNNMNPKFQIYEGNFSQNQRSGMGILYNGKSLNIIYKGNWIENKQNAPQEPIATPKPEASYQPAVQKKKIVIMENGQIINNRQNNKILPEQTKTWIMYNQQITDNDIRILQSSNGWFTSSIIDAFSLYLNLKEEECFLSIRNQQEQINYKRVLILPSDLYTSMHEGDKIQNRNIFEKHLLEYKPINFKIELIFAQVLFVINKNNLHWLLAKVDFASKNLIIFDSMKKREHAYSLIFNILNGIFQQLEKITVADTYQQNNGYDCGPCTCLNMLKESNLRIDIEKQEIIPFDMRYYLLQLLKNKE